MVLSGSFHTNVGSHWRLQEEWSATQNYSANTSTITAKLYWMALDQYGAVYSSATKTCAIYIQDTWNSTSAADMAALSGNQKKLIHQWSHTVQHNADGTFTTNLDGYFDAQVTLSGTYYDRINLPTTYFQLDTIPRKSTLTSSPSWTAGTNNTISVSKASSSFTQRVYIDVQNRDGTWTNIKNIDFSVSTSSNFTQAEYTSIFNVLDGRTSTASRYNLHTYDSSGNDLGYNTYTGTVTAPTESYLASGTDYYLYIDQQISWNLTVSNTAFANTIQFSFGSFTKTFTGVGTGITWTPSPAEQQSMYAQIPNSNSGSGTITVTTYYNGEQVRSSWSHTVWMYVRNSHPIFSASSISYADVNSTTTAITGNDQYIIQNESTLRAYVNTAATGTDGASVSKYIITINGISKTITTTGYSTIGIISAGGNIPLTIKAVDSRGNYTTVSKTVTILPYSPPSIDFSADRQDNFNNSTTLSLNGGYSAVSVGGTAKNTLDAVQYRYKQTTTSTWGAWTNFSYSASGGKYSATSVVLNLDNLKSWDVEVQVSDKLATNTSTVTVGSGAPIFFLDSDLSSLGFNMFPVWSNSVESASNLYIVKDNPWLTLDSSSTGGNGVEQGAGVSIGEHGYKGAASLHLTYTGDGYGHIGMGVVDATSGIAQYEAMRLFYQNNNVTFYGNVYFSSDIYLGDNHAIYSLHNNDFIVKDHGNGNVTLNAAGDYLYLGYVNTNSVRLYSNMVANNGTYQLIDTINLNLKGNSISADHEMWVQPNLRFTTQSGVAYLQAGTTASDTSGIMRITRQATATTNISAFEVYADESIFSGTVNFTTGPLMDMASGQARWQVNPSNYIYQYNVDGRIYFYMGGAVKHSFNADGTKSGGTIEIDGKNLGMSPMDSPQVLIEYIEFDVPLDEKGKKIFLEPRYAKAIDHFAIFPNNGTIVEKGSNYFVIKGSGIADVRIVGERTGLSSIFFADLSTLEALK